MDLRVIHRHHDRTLGIPLQILINDGIKQLFRLPGTPRKKLIVGVPVLLGAAQYTDALGNGAVAHGCWPSQRVLDCTPVRAAIGENIPPALLQHRDIVLGQRHGCPPLRVKTFLSLRRNRSPRAIFLTSEDTTDSRSRRRPCSFSIRSRISEIWRGLPARRSTSCTISSCDVRLSPAGSAVVLDFARRIARSWASRAISKALRTACSIGSLSSAVFFMADISCAKTCGNGAILRYVCQYNSVVDLRKCLNSRSPPLRGGDIYRETSAACDVHLQSRRPVLEFVRVIEIRTAGGAGVGPGNGGNKAQRNIERVFGLEVAPVEDDFPADDFVGIDPAGLNQFFELIVPDFQTTWNSHDSHRSGDRLIALVGDGYDGFGDTSLLNL